MAKIPRSAWICLTAICCLVAYNGYRGRQFESEFRQQLPDFAEKAGLQLPDDYELIDSHKSGLWFFSEPGGTYTFRSFDPPRCDHLVKVDRADFMWEMMRDHVASLHGPKDPDEISRSESDWHQEGWNFSILLASDSEGCWFQISTYQD